MTEVPIPGHPAAPPLPEHSPVARVARALAIVGGLLSVATALLVTTSVTLRWLGLGSINGDFELVQIGVALSVFCFLPLTQARRGNIMVDTFTAWLPLRVQRAMDAFWDFVYAGFMALTAWCLMNGARDALASGLTSAMLGLNLWPVFAATVLLILLLVVTAVDTALQLLRSRS
ncbi:MAG: TRAP transporter small permease [Microvirga sp.]|nr:TRAP transporter small permease [Beijerinckiaceae bacterium]HZY23590.1 TRAP transporter small permease [Beijerinckiaceae bacterium]